MRAADAKYLKDDGVGSFYRTNAWANGVFSGPNAAQIVSEVNKAAQKHNVQRIKDGLPIIPNLGIAVDDTGKPLVGPDGNVVFSDSIPEVKAKFNLLFNAPVTESSAIDPDAIKAGRAKAQNSADAIKANAAMKIANARADAEYRLGKKYTAETVKLTKENTPQQNFDEISSKIYIDTNAKGQPIARVRLSDLQVNTREYIGVEGLTTKDPFVNVTFNRMVDKNGKQVDEAAAYNKYNEWKKTYKGTFTDFLNKANIDFDYEVIGKVSDPGTGKPTYTRSGRLTSFQNQEKDSDKNDIQLQDGQPIFNVTQRSSVKSTTESRKN